MDLITERNRTSSKLHAIWCEIGEQVIRYAKTYRELKAIEEQIKAQNEEEEEYFRESPM